MNIYNLPDFSEQGYKVIRELGCNREGGRVTYLAKKIGTGEQVVIKEFQFAKNNTEWRGYKAHENEIKMLQGLKHPAIPCYLDSFETPSGFCMVQEYKDAQPLFERRSFNPDKIKVIAVKLLGILVYLQQDRIPFVIHRDIKPENTLVDDQLNVYLVDFGFARIDSGEVAISSIAGTLGFMPPEQIYNQQPTKATDLYGLGATLICVLTGTKSTQMYTLIDEDGRIEFKDRVPNLSRRFIDWLEKMVQPRQKDRYANAKDALEALDPIYVNRVPEVRFSKSTLQFQASQREERLTQVLEISNSIQTQRLRAGGK